MPSLDAASLHLLRLLPARTLGYLLLLAGLVLLLAGCEKLPRPFEPEDKTGNPLLAPVEGQTLEVLPLQGEAPTLPDGGALQIASALVEAGLPATYGQRTATSRLLLGTAELGPGPLGEHLRLRWEVYGPGGSLLNVYLQEADLPAGAWMRGGPGTLAKIGLEAAPILAPAAQGPEEVAARQDSVAREGQRPTVAVYGLWGAPGDGGQSVPRALASIMTQRGFLVVDDLTPGGFAIDGVMLVENAANGQQQVSLVWRVLSGQEGEFLGQVEQANVIPAGSLDGPWGDIAAIVAAAAADGLLDLMSEAGKL